MLQTEAPHFLSPNTVVALIVFLVVYETYLLKKVSHSKLDLFDFFILSSVAILPVLFSMFPGVMILLSRQLGIEFPFLILFGSIFLVVFIFMYAVVRRLYMLERKLITLAQEKAIIIEELNRKLKSQK